MQGSHPDWQRRPAQNRADRPGRVYGGRATGSASSRSPGVYSSRSSSANGNRDRGSAYRSGNRDRLAARERATGRAGRPDHDAERAERDSAKPAGRTRRRAPVWAILTVSFGALLLLGSGTAIAGYEIVNNRYADNVQQENLLGAAAAEPGKELDGPLNLLMLGVEEQGEGARSDTIMVLHIPSAHNEAYLLSVPRDTLVSVPGYWDMKITEAFDVGYENGGGWSGGAQMIATILNSLTGLQFDGAAIVNFDGFKRIIDTLGGIEFCVDTPATSEHIVLVDGEPMGIGQARREGHYFEQVRYEEGCQTLEGWQALDYVRQRKNLEDGSSDYGRQRHQRQLIEAMAEQATSTDVLTNLSTLDSLILAAGDALIVDTNNADLADFVFTLKDIRPSNLISLQTNGGEFNSIQIDGKSYEQLTPESLEMFRAAANDSMALFVANHPEFVNQD
ncbi:MAG TPA: LCP family protein [Natronosporangium sp.]